MVAYNVSKYSNLSDTEKIERIKSYDTADLLKVIRSFEESPRDYSPDIIKLISSRLYEKGIILMY
jgi:hypothetical protein